jgi:hypothetical protein
MDLSSIHHTFYKIYFHKLAASCQITFKRLHLALIITRWKWPYFKEFRLQSSWAIISLPYPTTMF